MEIRVSKSEKIKAVMDFYGMTRLQATIELENISNIINSLEDGVF